MSRLNSRTIGSTYEQIAGTYLKEQGYEIIEYNFHSKNGEVDIIAKEQEYLVFVEVKYRKDCKKGHPLEAVSVAKQKRISKSALFYLQKKNIFGIPVRFDVVAILGDQIELVKNAFSFHM
mgnify:CR=1 FL=1